MTWTAILIKRAPITATAWAPRTTSPATTTSLTAPERHGKGWPQPRPAPDDAEDDDPGGGDVLDEPHDDDPCVDAEPPSGRPRRRFPTVRHRPIVGHRRDRPPDRVAAAEAPAIALVYFLIKRAEARLTVRVVLLGVDVPRGAVSLPPGFFLVHHPIERTKGGASRLTSTTARAWSERLTAPGIAQEARWRTFRVGGAAHRPKPRRTGGAFWSLGSATA
jgi:hypothetical protein